MLTLDEALARILETTPILTPVEVLLPNALGMVIAEDIRSPHPFPPFTNSAMDGFAVRAAEIEGASIEHPIALPIHGEIAAGASEPRTLEVQTAVRIMTGAPLPEGADTVVPVEDTQTRGEEVLISAPMMAGRFVRKAGEDVAAGTLVIACGSLIRPAEIGLLAAAGRRTVQVYPRPRVAIVSTGDELIEPGNSLAFGQIFNSNSYALAAQVTEAGGQVIRRLHAEDTLQALRKAFDECAGADIILTSGGVSVGEHDHVKAVFGERGTVNFWRVAIRPGKPLAFGTWGRTVFFGLPGNPVSAMVTFELFVRPALRKMRGLADLVRPVQQARLMKDVTHESGRRSFQQAWVSKSASLNGICYSVEAIEGQGSHQTRSMSLSNALLVLPENVTQARAGESVSIILLDEARPY